MSSILSKGDDKLYLSSFNRLISTLHSYDNKPDEDTIHGLSELVYHYSLGLRGLLKPSYYLSSLDPGAGKTESISCFIKAWKASGFEVKGSILFCVNSKDQIDSLVKRLNLDDKDYSCLTSDERINALGLGSNQSHKAPVLITTQQMAESRTRDRGFSAAKDFFYADERRTLNIWDESFLPSAQVTVTAASLHHLASSLQYKEDWFADEIATLASKLTVDAVGKCFTVPVAIAGKARSIITPYRRQDGLGEEEGVAGTSTLPALNQTDRNALDALARIGGRSLRLGTYGGKASLTLVGATKPLPADFAPVIILDASGRVRGTYQHMEANGLPLVRLPATANDYSDVTLFVWRTASGKEVLSNDRDNRFIFAEIAKAIATHPNDDWLIIGPKAKAGMEVLRLIEASLPTPVLATAKLHYLHWGIHMATNAYKHVRRVIVVGTHHYSNPGYDSLAAAAIGRVASPLSVADRKKLRVSEYQHNLLQALMRSNARNAKDGKAGDCIAYLLTSRDISAGAIRDTFPGAELVLWNEPTKAPSTKQQELIDYLCARFREGAIEVTKSEAVRAIGINGNSLSKLLKEPFVARAITALGVANTNKSFKRLPAATTS